MAYVDQHDRFQLQMRSMEDFVTPDNPVRFVDAFVDQFDLNKLGFVVAEVKAEGRPAFNPKVFLKLYLYGYLNGLRSSRKLEKEATRNVEVHWLLGSLVPNYPGATHQNFRNHGICSKIRVFIFVPIQNLKVLKNLNPL